MMLLTYMIDESDMQRAEDAWQETIRKAKSKHR